MVKQNDILDVPAGPATPADEALLDNLASGQVEALAVAPKEGQYVPAAPAVASPAAQPAPKQAVAVAVAPELDESPAPGASDSDVQPIPARMMAPAQGSFLHTVGGQAALVIFGAAVSVAVYFALTRFGM